MISVGRSNGPIYVPAKAQDDVATCPLAAEYYAPHTACGHIFIVSASQKLALLITG